MTIFCVHPTFLLYHESNTWITKKKKRNDNISSIKLKQIETNFTKNEKRYSEKQKKKKKIIFGLMSTMWRTKLIAHDSNSLKDRNEEKKTIKFYPKTPCLTYANRFVSSDIRFHQVYLITSSVEAACQWISGEILFFFFLFKLAILRAVTFRPAIKFARFSFLVATKFEKSFVQFFERIYFN